MCAVFPFFLSPPAGARRWVASGAAGVRARTLERITNAIKDTVSVLYWYEELSSPRLAIFGTVLRNFFLCLFALSPLPGGACAKGRATERATARASLPAPSAASGSAPPLASTRPLWSGVVSYILTRRCLGLPATGHGRRGALRGASALGARARGGKKKRGSTALRVPKSSLTSVLTKPVAA